MANFKDFLPIFFCQAADFSPERGGHPHSWKIFTGDTYSKIHFLEDKLPSS